MFAEALPALSMLERILARDVFLEVKEDNEATIKVIRKGYSPKLRHIQRTHKVNLASLTEQLSNPNILLAYINTLEQVADIFTKAVEPMKWNRAVQMLGMKGVGGKPVPIDKGQVQVNGQGKVPLPG